MINRGHPVALGRPFRECRMDQTALDINTVAMLVSLVLIPLIGALSDSIGRKPILLAATGGLFVLA